MEVDRERKSMEESLLEEQREKVLGCSSKTWSALFQEVKRLGYIAGPLVVVMMSQYLLQVVSMVMAGHLDELSLSSTAIAISVTWITGTSILVGIASALETTCGQAYGAEQYQKVGIQTYTAMFSLFLVCLPISLVWINMENLLVLLGQDPLISHEAGRFAIWFLPALFGHVILQPLIRYFQTQSLIFPMSISSCATFFLHIPLCWVLVFKSGLGNIGAALSMGISVWLNAIFLISYMMFSPECEKTRAPISMERFKGTREFLRFAIPSAFMTCLEWWSYELIILMSGILSNPRLETSVLSICQSIISTSFTIAYGLSAAVSTRVSNELGAGNAQAARTATFAVMIFTVIETSVVTIALFASRHVLGYSFSNEKEVVDYIANMAPLVCVSVVLENIQGVLSGVARGCGWQDIGAFINLGAFYLLGIPAAAVLGFWVKLRGRGLWIGILSGSFVQTVLLCLITSCTNWEKQARKARERLFEDISLINGLED